MSKGPLFNNIKRDFASRNSMGFDEVINSLQEKSSPIITNVTDSVFYFAFIVWSINDYIRSTEYSDRTLDNMNAHFKLQNYFFTTSFLLKDIDTTGASGGNYIRNYINSNDSDIFIYNPDYIDTLQTTMGYYRPGLDPLFLIKNETLEGEALKCPQITPYGEELAIAFEDEIKDTEYFKNYRNSESVPRSVLIELGNKANLHMTGMLILQKKLYEVLFDNKYNKDYINALTLDKDYILYTKEKYKCNVLNDIRKIEFDYYSPRSLNFEIPANLENISKEWEIIIGRQYFTLGLSMIWKYMLNLLDEPMPEEKWLNKCRDKALENINKDSTIEQLIKECYFTYEEREELTKVGVKQIESNLFVDGLKVMLSIYNRFDERDDLNKSYEDMFGVNDSYDTIPLVIFFESVKKHFDELAVDYLEIIMRRLIIQNKIVGYKKLQRGKNGYYYEYNNGYYYKLLDFDYGFSGNRLENVYKALSDLNMLGDE